MLLKQAELFRFLRRRRGGEGIHGGEKVGKRLHFDPEFFCLFQFGGGGGRIGCPDLWGKKPDYMDRLTGKPREPEQEFDYLAEFMRPKLDDKDFMESVIRTISRHIAENELDFAYIIRDAEVIDE